jgi:hypothetical protein
VRRAGFNLCVIGTLSEAEMGGRMGLIARRE